MNDPFTLLGLPRRFDIDAGQLQAAYLKRSAALHPDRISDPIEQSHAARQAAAINDARAVLSNDEQRANALLTSMGGPAKEADKSLPEGFLQSIMEVRDEMELVLAAHDPEERKRFEQWVQVEQQNCRQQVAALFDKAGSSPDPGTLKAIRQKLNAWRYIQRMQEQLDPDWRSPM